VKVTSPIDNRNYRDALLRFAEEHLISPRSNPIQAIRDLRSILRSFPSQRTRAQLLLEAADYFYSRGQHMTAMDLYNLVPRVRIAEYTQLAHLGSGRCCQKLGQFACAEYHFRRILRSYRATPNAAVAADLLYRLFVRLGEFRKSAFVLHSKHKVLRTIARGRHRPIVRVTAWLDLADSYLSLGEHPLCLRYLKKAVKIAQEIDVVDREVVTIVVWAWRRNLTPMLRKYVRSDKWIEFDHALQPLLEE